MRRFNPLGLLALLSIIAVLGFLTDNKGWFGFFGFFYYIRYFWVLPDEFFLENVRKTATLAFSPACFPSLSTCFSSAHFMIQRVQPPWPLASALPRR